MDYQHLVSAGGIFKLGFFSPENSKQRYIGIWYSDDPKENIVWVANRNTPIIDTYGVLTIDGDGNLKIVHGNETLVVLNSNQATTNATATLEDTGNFIMREVNSKRVFVVPATGAFILGGDPNGATQLFMWQRGDLYWTSGAWGRNGSFDFLNFLTVDEKYQMEYISDGDEKYFTYGGSNSMWVIEPADKEGRFINYIGSSNLCDGYRLDQGCFGAKLPECRTSKDVFEQKLGFMHGLIYKMDTNSSLGLSDCKAECMSDCDCVAYACDSTNDTGCDFWSRGSSFREYTNGIPIYLLRSDKVALALVILLLFSLYHLRRKFGLEGEKEASNASGYMSPEYAMEGIFSVKSDVFSFGVLLLEIVSGRKNSSFYDLNRHLNLIGYEQALKELRAKASQKGSLGAGGRILTRPRKPRSASAVYPIIRLINWAVL
ncbi:hypothetical protein HHK36_021601 [Tetracentron sinense]|uniref:Uncharacterized protein n=1 Tax=Tetracentron sinense TaxID=13715 RepID=A0A835D7I5_TETSI|nr:hypothetical protein HHK36_021601 [Tetracentron sinense]